MSGGRVERRLAAILAADVVGYSRLMGEDEAGTLSRLGALRRDLIDPKVAEHRGRIVKTTGDGLLVEFPSVVEAVACAIAVQQGMGERNSTTPGDQRIEFRIGINLGDVIVEGDDIHGDGVNVAARLEALAEPGGIFVSRTVRDHVGDRLDVTFEDLGEQQVKNIAQAIHVYRVHIETRVSPADDRRYAGSIAVLPFRNRRSPEPLPAPTDRPAPAIAGGGHGLRRWRDFALGALGGAIIGGAVATGVTVLIRPPAPPNALALVTAKQAAEQQVRTLQAELDAARNKTTTAETGLDAVQRALRLLGHLQSEAEGGFGPGTI